MDNQPATQKTDKPTERKSQSQRLACRCVRCMGERPFIFILSALVGVGTGIMACLLKQAIAHISELISAHLPSQGPDWSLLAVPAVGVMIVVGLKHLWFKGNISHGVRVIREQIKSDNAHLPTQITYSPLVSTAITLGLGGSAGAEGPIAFSGAALGSCAARGFGITGRMAMIMMACGAGAGIAAIFKAPIGGALFVLECLRMGLGSFGVMVLFVTTLVAAITATALQGFTLDLVMDQVTYYNPHILPWALALGVFCGVYSLYYSYIMKLIERWLNRMQNPWIKGCLAGVLTGVCLLLFPSLYGEGYKVMSQMLNGNFSALTFGTMLSGATPTPGLILIVATGILAIKCFATSLSYNGGGVTGEFAPTLFAGCFAGYVFGAGCNYLFGTDLPVSQLAFMGMAGVMAGAIRAPLMAIFLVVEMSSAYSLLLPLSATASISFGIVRGFTADSFFTRRMDRKNGLMWKLLRLMHLK